MPTTRELSWSSERVEGTVDAYIELVDQKDVYFTDEQPEFKITIENNTPWDMKNSSHMAWVIAIGEGRPEPFVEKRYPNYPVASGEKRTLVISNKSLSLEGHGIVALGRGEIRDVDSEEGEFHFNTGNTRSDVYEPLATFSVWDREHYEVVHEQPQRIQQFSLFASFAVVLFAVVQFATVLELPIIAFISGAILFVIYGYSGLLWEFIEAIDQHRSNS